MKMRTAHTVILVLFISAGLNLVRGQDVIDEKIVISGTVYDQETSMPLIQAGVNYFDPATQEYNGTVTDNEGKYMLEVPVNISTLTFTFEGMKKKNIELGDVTELDVYLEKEDEGSDRQENVPVKLPV